MPGFHAGRPPRDKRVRYWDALVLAAQTVHGEGGLVRLIGRDVPVLLNDNLNALEYVRSLNRRANPPQFHELLDRTWHAYE